MSSSKLSEDSWENQPASSLKAWLSMCYFNIYSYILSKVSMSVKKDTDLNVFLI